LAFKEALRNAVTHSKANNLIIELAFVDRNLKIVVRDDGIGFDPSKTGGKRNGLANLRRRASNVGGSADIRSAVGQGTEIVLSIPAGDGQSRH
jgi:signal transduction histidine kinase